MLYNDLSLRREHKLPRTGIETDSYIAVLLLEQQKALDFSALKDMAETVRGSFAFTVLDGDVLQLNNQGRIQRGSFTMPRTSFSRYAWPDYDWWTGQEDRAYVRALKSVAGAFGYAPEEIEEVFYCGEL